jgi:hypothetical protein
MRVVSVLSDLLLVVIIAKCQPVNGLCPNTVAAAGF